MADNQLYKSLMGAAYKATGGQGAGFSADEQGNVYFERPKTQSVKNYVAESAKDNGASNPTNTTPTPKASFVDRFKSPDGMTHDEFVSAQKSGQKNPSKFGQLMIDLDTRSANNPWAFSADTMAMDTGVKDPAASKIPNYGSYYDNRSGGYLSDRNKAKAQRESLENDFYNLYGYHAPSYMTDEQITEFVQKARADASSEINDYYRRNNDALVSHYTGGESSPAVTQNYGSYYDGRSGNDVLEQQERRQREEELRRMMEEQAAVWSQSPENMILNQTTPAAPAAQSNSSSVNVVPPNPYRDQTTYGNTYSPYSLYVSGQERTPDRDSGGTGRTEPIAPMLPRQGEEAQPGRPGGTYNGRPNYGRGNIDLNDRPILWNDDGSWSTVDSTIWGVDGKQVLMPTVIQQDGQWKHVNPDTALQHYLDTGEHLGKFDTVEEAGAYGEQLHNDQARQYYPEMQQQREERRNSGRVYIDNAHGDMTPNARYADIYNQLERQGMTKEEILEWAESDGMEYMSPEEAMRFYIYVGNER